MTQQFVRHFIAGSWQVSQSTEFIEIEDPNTGEMTESGPKWGLRRLAHQFGVPARIMGRSGRSQWQRDRPGFQLTIDVVHPNLGE